MRFLSFLPILLLVTALHAQNTCSISNVTTTVTASPAANCQYFATLNFDHSGTSNQFFVKVGGIAFGPFTYNQLPVTVGPFNGLPNVGVSLSFIVQDAVFPDCQEDGTLSLPPCATNACAITNLSVNAFDCDPASNTYAVKIDFDVTGPTNDLFDVFAANGQLVGTFPLSALPVTIPNFPWSGGPVDALKVCINDNNDCCAVKEFPAPDCLNSGCGIFNIKVETGECFPDSTYEAWVSFQSILTVIFNFDLYVNDTLFGSFSSGQLPVYVPHFPWNGGLTDDIKICITNTQPPCCVERSFPVPACLTTPPCAVTDLKVETGDCTSDSTFSLTINFTVADSTQVDSFELGGNGQFLGMFAIADLPVIIQNFPWNGLVFNNIRVRTGNDPRCRAELQFTAPDCLPFKPCAVTHISALAGACTSDSTYKARINFQATNPGNGTFTVLVNNTVLDTFPLSAAPLNITNFPWGGGPVDVVTVCINDSVPTNTGCCKTIELAAPPCLFPDSCQIVDLKVEVGDCTSDSTYKVWVIFQVVPPIPGASVAVFANGELVGTFPVTNTPLAIPNFPASGNDIDIIEVCLLSPNALTPICCRKKEIVAPDCGGGGPCEIFDLKVLTGDCTSDSTYVVKINFQVQNPVSDIFGVWANGIFQGVFNLNQLPLTIQDFPWNGGPNDVVKVCLFNANNPIPTPLACCAVEEFPVPDCLNGGGPCEIYNLTVLTGDCTSDSTYVVKINFQVQNPPSNTFGVWVNGVFWDTYTLNQLPIIIQNFPWNGGPNDVVKICFSNTTDPATACCRTKEFPVPDCLNGGGGDCEIVDLWVQTGTCTSDSTYMVWLNFSVLNATSNVFGVWANGEFLGEFNLGQLPLMIDDFPWNGGPNDVVKVCILTTNSTPPACCKTREFPVPDCLGNGNCDIYDLVVETGACTSDSTYKVVLDFEVNNPPSSQFAVWGNGVLLGTYNLGQLPLVIPDFHWNGGPNDVIKVCFLNSGAVGCCETVEFPVPDCLGNGPCEIYDLTVETGDCTGPSSYKVIINFQVQNPVGNTFGVWANGVFLGVFNLNQLPLALPNFPSDGGPNDVIKVCIAPNTNAGCCRTKEFPVPDCIGSDCHIWDVHVVRTPCLCGQFFALVSFEHDNGGAGGFDIGGNGVNYGNYPYNTPQPIILGPLNGDGTTNYEFVVRDHIDHDCKDFFELGTVDCDVYVVEPAGGASISISPNPAAEWLNVTALWPNGAPAGQSTVEIFQADGRKALSVTVPNGNNFQLNLNDLPAGMYRLVLLAEPGRVEGKFAKQ